jgi:outer membrane protein TolC
MFVNHFRFIHAALFFGALHIALPIWGAEPLTLADAQRQALERSRQLNAQDAAISASREMAVSAGQLSDPVLKLGIDNLPIDGADRFSLSRDFMTMRRVGVMQEMTHRDKRQLKSERFEREAEKSIAEKSSVIAIIERDTALAWLDRHYTEVMASTIAEQIPQARFEIDAAESAYRSGRGSQADVFAAKSALAMVEDRASEISRRVRSAKIALARWSGDTAEGPLAEFPDMDVISLRVPTLETDLLNHPEIVILNKQGEIAATESHLAQANTRADWSWDVAFQQRGPAYSNMISVGVSIPLQWDRKLRQDREVASKQAMVEEVRAKRDDLLRARVAEVRSMIAEWDNGRERRSRYQRELLPLAKSRTEATLAAYRGGKASLAEVLAIRRGETEMRLLALQLDLEIARLWAQINFILPNSSMSSAANALPTPSKEPK